MSDKFYLQTSDRDNKNHHDPEKKLTIQRNVLSFSQIIIERSAGQSRTPLEQQKAVDGLNLQFIVTQQINIISTIIELLNNPTLVIPSFVRLLTVNKPSPSFNARPTSQRHIHEGQL